MQIGSLVMCRVCIYSNIRLVLRLMYHIFTLDPDQTKPIVPCLWRSAPPQLAVMTSQCTYLYYAVLALQPVLIIAYVGYIVRKAQCN
jgi:hypothetical protein